MNERIIVKIKNTGNYPLLKTEYILNGEYLGYSNKPPFDFVIPMEEMRVIKKDNELRVVGYDVNLNKGEDVVNIKIKY